MSHDDHDPTHAVFGFLVSALRGGGDVGSLFPQSDAEDLALGASSIPGAVTGARRAGRPVIFVTTSCLMMCCWYWQLPDGSRIYNFDQRAYNQVGQHNHGRSWNPEQELAGPCPQCGNPITHGAKLTAAQVAQLP